MKRFWFSAILALAGLASTGLASTIGFTSTLAAQEASARPGIVATKPESGPFVETPQGFMVPYKVQIPGTDVTFEMIPVPGGKFKVGSPDGESDRKEDEGPQAEIEVAPYWIGKYEVTWAEYKSFMALHDVFKGFMSNNMRIVAADQKRDVDVITAPSNLYEPSFTFEAGDAKNEPAATMTQYAAKQYTKWLSVLTDDFYRLPTEVEWEYACRAGSDKAYTFGDDPSQLEEYAWFEDNSDEKRHQVGTKKPNAFGIYDMHGNVAEWVLDGHTEDGYKDFADKKSSAEAIHWPTKVDHRVVRGGSFEMSAADLRSASRLFSDDEAWKNDDPNFPKSPWWFTTTPATGVGFRLIRPLDVPAEREAKEKFWKADLDEIIDIADLRIDNEGRGARGKIDKDLPEAIKELKKKTGQ